MQALVCLVNIVTVVCIIVYAKSSSSPARGVLYQSGIGISQKEIEKLTATGRGIREDNKIKDGFKSESNA